MKKYFLSLMILISVLSFSGCGKEEKGEESTSISSEQIEASDKQGESKEKSLDELYDEAVSQTSAEVRSAISGSSVLDLDGTINAYIEINNAGMMADVADFTTKTIDQIAPGYSKYDIIIESDLANDKIVTWHSYDNKTGILINTLTDYYEENVTIDGLYSWKEGK